ncbi:MAG: molybdenum cofactor guanylyltransferase [Oscillospiraceae bacterium]|nr:molybdenum cofactor guanylyltransferase [Oscillospiraceae bacterium]
MILIGGNSRRMGRDKALLPFEGGTFISSLTERYKTLGNVAVSVDIAGRFDCEGAVELVDKFPGKGPLNGLYSAFSETDEEYVFLTATDIPFGDAGLAEYLAHGLNGYDACVIRRANGYVEPLFAAYSRSCFNEVRDFLTHDKRAARELLEALNVRYIDESLLCRWDINKILLNVNTPEDYRAVTED